MPRRSLLRLGAGAAALGGAAVTTGCAGLGGRKSDSGNGLEFFWYVEGDRAKYTRNAARRFEKAHTGVTVNARSTGYDSYWDKLATETAGGNPPDVFQLELVRLSEHAARGTVRPLDDLAAGLIDRLEPDVKASCTYEGKVYFLPTGLSVTPGLVVDEDALRRLDLAVPSDQWTMDDFTEFCGRVWDTSKRRTSGSSDLGGNHWAMEAYARGRGEQPFNEDGKLTLTRETVGDWLDLWAKLRKSHGCVSMERTAEGGGFENATVVTGDAAISDVASAKGMLGLQGLTRQSLGLLTFPLAERGGPAAATAPPIEWWAISAKTDDDTAKRAVSFCEYLLTDPKTVDGMVIEHGIPVVPSLRAKAKRSATSSVRATFDAFETVREAKPAAVLPPPKGAGELLTQVLGELNQDVGFGKTTVPRAMERFFTESKRILGE